MTSLNMPAATIPGVGKPVSRLIQGCIMLDPDRREWSYELLDAAFEMGGNAFDHAHVYGGGRCERVFGQWLADRGLRDRVVIITKGAHHSPDRRRVTPFDIASDLHDSLARMQVDSIDLYLLHRDDPDVPVGPIIEALNEHKAAGRIDAFGGSNWSHQRLTEANAYAREHGLTPFTAGSPNFTLAEMVDEPWADCIAISTEGDREAYEWYRTTGLPLLAWSSLGRGFFSGRYDPADPEADELTRRIYGSEANHERLARARELAAEKGASVAQIALAWLAAQPLNVFPLVGCHAPDEFRDCLAGWNLGLTPAEADWLDLRAAER